MLSCGLIGRDLGIVSLSPVRRARQAIHISVALSPTTPVASASLSILSFAAGSALPFRRAFAYRVSAHASIAILCAAFGPLTPQPLAAPIFARHFDRALRIIA